MKAVLNDEGNVVAGDEATYIYGEDTTSEVLLEKSIDLFGEPGKFYIVTVSAPKKELIVPFTATVAFGDSDKTEETRGVYKTQVFGETALSQDEFVLDIRF